MHKFIRLIMLLLTPFSFIHAQETSFPHFIKKWEAPTTYEQVLQLLDEIDSECFLEKHVEEDVEKITRYIADLARKGILPGEEQKVLELEEDIEELLQEEAPYPFLGPNIEAAVSLWGSDYSIKPCGKISKSWKKTKKFVKKHKKAIIISAVVVTAVAAVTVAVLVANSAAACATTAAMGAQAIESQIAESKTENTPSEKPFEEKVGVFKKNLAKEAFFEDPFPLSLEETGKVLHSLFAQDCFNQWSKEHLTPKLSYEQSQEIKGLGFYEMEKSFSVDYSPETTPDLVTLSYQRIGEKALEYEYYPQAVENFTKALEKNPKDPFSYLQRSTSFFHMKEYEKSLQDFHAFTKEATLPENPLSISEFTYGFVKGLPKGTYESGKGILLFLGDLITHPIHTSSQVYESLSTLVKLVKEDEWGIIGEALSPEIHQLVTSWDTLSSDKRGELAGYALAKNGLDVLAPGAITKIASKSIKSAKELSAICKNIKIAHETLLLEAASEIGNSTKIKEIIYKGEELLNIAENLGFSSSEVGKLKQVGTLEPSLETSYKSLMGLLKSGMIFKDCLY